MSCYDSYSSEKRSIIRHVQPYIVEGPFKRAVVDCCSCFSKKRNVSISCCHSDMGYNQFKRPVATLYSGLFLSKTQFRILVRLISELDTAKGVHALRFVEDLCQQAVLQYIFV